MGYYNRGIWMPQHPVRQEIQPLKLTRGPPTPPPGDLLTESLAARTTKASVAGRPYQESRGKIIIPFLLGSHRAKLGPRNKPLPCLVVLTNLLISRIDLSATTLDKALQEECFPCRKLTRQRGFCAFRAYFLPNYSLIDSAFSVVQSKLFSA